MKALFALYGFLLSFSLCPLVASDCHSSCFDRKKACMGEVGHTFNSCHEQTMACKMSCNSEKPEKFFHDPGIRVVLNPIMDGMLS